MALLTKLGTLVENVCSQRNQGLTWKQLQREIVHKFISPVFELQQQDALEALRQRSGESLTSCIHEFKTTYEEAQVKSDLQEATVCTFLSGLLDRRLVESITKKKPTTLEEA